LHLSSVRGAKQNPIRPAILRGGSGFFVLILGREVYPDVTKSNREAQVGEQAPHALGFFYFLAFCSLFLAEEHGFLYFKSGFASPYPWRKKN
jgi:hypothetical protein